MRPYPDHDYPEKGDPRPIPGAGAVIAALLGVLVAALVAAILIYGR